MSDLDLKGEVVAAQPAEVATEAADRGLKTARKQSWGFQPGVSGNPGGRPKGLASRVREATKDGHDLVDFWLSVFHGRLPKGTKGRVTLRDRKDAAEWLADRGFGKALQTVDSTVRRTTLFAPSATNGTPDDEVVLPAPDDA